MATFNQSQDLFPSQDSMDTSNASIDLFPNLDQTIASSCKDATGALEPSNVSTSNNYIHTNPERPQAQSTPTKHVDIYTMSQISDTSLPLGQRSPTYTQVQTGYGDGSEDEIPRLADIFSLSEPPPTNGALDSSSHPVSDDEWMDDWLVSPPEGSILLDDSPPLADPVEGGEHGSLAPDQGRPAKQLNQVVIAAHGRAGHPHPSNGGPGNQGVAGDGAGPPAGPSHRLLSGEKRPGTTEQGGPTKRLKQATITAQGRVGSPLPSSDDDDTGADDDGHGDGGGAAVKAYDIQLKGTRRFRNTASETTYKVRFREQWLNEPMINIENELRDMFGDILDRVRDQHNGEDGVRVYIEHPQLRHPVVVPPRAVQDMSPDHIMDCVENVCQSEQDIAVCEDLQIQVGVYNSVRGGARAVEAQDRARTAKSVVRIQNPYDQLCLARALAVGLTHWEDNNPSCTTPRFYKASYRQIKDPQRGPCHTTHQEKMAWKIMDAAGFPRNRVCNLTDIPAFEEALDVEIEVISAAHGNQSIHTPSTARTRRVFLWYTKGSENDAVGHFDTITNMKGFLGTYFWCDSCRKGGYSRQHNCETTCIVCKSTACPVSPTKKGVTCHDCNMTCRSEACYARHKEKTRGFSHKKTSIPVGPSQCQRFWKCLKCYQTLDVSKRTQEQHICGEYACQHCGEFQTTEHFCSMRARGLQNISDKKVFFDIETDQSSGQHVPNFIVAESACDACEDDDVTADSTCNSCGSRCQTCENRKKHKIPCNGCGKRRVKFSGYNSQQEFCTWAFQAQHKNFTFLAHNSRAFDSYFPYNYLLRNGCTPDVIMTGSKITYMFQRKDVSIRFLDSACFLPMPLAKLPKTFGFEEQHKGYFCHWFNRPENQDYTGKLPAEETYGPDQMAPEARAKFKEWYATHKDDNFNFREEIDKYCTNDVEILRIACTKFRKLLKSATGKVTEEFNPETNQMESTVTGGVDPFQSITIASTCQSIYRYIFLEEAWTVLLKTDQEEALATMRDPVWRDAKMTVRDGFLVQMDDGQWAKTSETAIAQRKFIRSPIAVEPSGGYAARNNYSKASIEWLSWQEKTRTTEIQHALKPGGEHAIINQSTKRKLRLDGYAKVGGQEIGFDFLGCIWHGCPSCFKNKDAETDEQKVNVPRDPHTRQTLQQRYALYQERKRYLTEERNMKLIEIWECQWSHTKRTNKNVKRFVAGLNIRDRLKPRDSFFGGRTNATKLYWKNVRGNRRFKAWYKDFTSLYPAVNKYERYPVGTPRIIRPEEIGDSVDISQYFGIIQCRVLPPRNLYHPVLPCKNQATGKLTFSLCAHCAEHAVPKQKQKRRHVPKTCKCTDEKRAMEGTWVAAELQVALAQGYRIMKVHEVHHWDETVVYDRAAGTDGLFSKYIDTFLKIKQSSSGYPAWAKTDAEKQQYVRDYFKHEGIQLDPNSIEKNAGLRAISKLCLNSFWGKFGQRTMLGKTAIIRDPAEFYRILSNPTQTITDWTILSDDCMLLQWTHTAEFEPETKNTNVYIATFTTAYARIRLYEVLAKLGRSVIYFDTDSVIYETEEGQEDPLQTGDYLGDLTDELNPGAWIIEFVSCGPKNYGYKTSDGQVIVKVKGFRLDYNAASKINFESMKEELFNWHNDGESAGITVENPHKMCRDKKRGVIFNRVEKKRYNVVYNKRVVQENMDTLPYGY